MFEAKEPPFAAHTTIDVQQRSMLNLLQEKW
jgi:hypothetical protein